MSWIKMRAELASDPCVMRICRLTGMDRFSVIGRLFFLWSWADANSADGRINFATEEDVANVVGDAKFVEALRKINWLKVKKMRIEIPNFERHNGESSKARSLKNQRQAKWRAFKTVDATPSTAPSTAHSSSASTRGEERRGEDKTQALPTPTIAPARAQGVGNKDSLEKQSTTTGNGWRRDPDLAAKKGAAIGVKPHAGESLESYVRRIDEFNALKKRQQPEQLLANVLAQLKVQGRPP